MSSKVLLLFAAVLTFAAATENIGHFHCGRSGQECDNGGTCNATMGTCSSCSGNAVGYDCGFDSTGKTSTCDTSPCENGGTCWWTGSAPYSCQCPPDYFGDNCENNRVQVECNGENITVSYYPQSQSAFDGIAFLGFEQDNQACRLNVSGTYFTGTFDKANDCDSINDISTSDRNATYTKTLNIYFNNQFFDDNDLALNVTCIYRDNATVTSNATGVIGQGQEIDEIETAYEPARLSVRDSNLAELAGPVTLGERVKLYNYLDDSNLYTSLLVEDCTATDPDNSKTVTIITGGCPTEKAKKLFFSTATVVSSPKDGISHDIKIFKLDANTTTLTFTCNVLMCRASASATCAVPSCTFTPMTRRKRQASSEEDDTKEQSVQAIVFIEEPGLVPDAVGTFEDVINQIEGNGAPGTQSHLMKIVIGLSMALYYLLN